MDVPVEFAVHFQQVHLRLELLLGSRRRPNLRNSGALGTFADVDLWWYGAGLQSVHRAWVPDPQHVLYAISGAPDLLLYALSAGVRTLKNPQTHGWGAAQVSGAQIFSLLGLRCWNERWQSLVKCLWGTGGSGAMIDKKINQFIII